MWYGKTGISALIKDDYNGQLNDFKLLLSNTSVAL